MAVKIRLLRMGRKKKPFYRVVVMDVKARRDGRYLEKIGYYNPVAQPAEINIDKEKALKWLGEGAQPTETVKNLFQKEGIALEWHLIRNKADEKTRNVEMQKWELAKKERKGVTTAAAPAVEEPVTAAPVVEEVKETEESAVEEVTIEEPADETAEEPAVDPIAAETAEEPAAENETAEEPKETEA